MIDVRIINAEHKRDINIPNEPFLLFGRMIPTQEGFFKYMYLYDLKVNSAYRKCGVAKSLIEKAKAIAKEKGYMGIYTQGQDNNLGACLFYIRGNRFH